MTPRPAVFLDRDGTIVREVDFLRTPDEVELLPGAAAALVALERAGFARVVVTNQSGIARGYLDEPTLAAIHARMEALLAAEGASVDLILHCPHHPTEASPENAHLRIDCECRKPRPGMLREAIERLDLDPRRSWTVGDSARDLDAGAALDIPGILVATGKGRAELARLRSAGTPPEHFVADAMTATEAIVARS